MAQQSAAEVINTKHANMPAFWNLKLVAKPKIVRCEFCRCLQKQLIVTS